MIIIDKIQKWRLKRTIPELIKGKQYRYDSDGLTKIPVNEDQEVKDYQNARKREKELRKKFEL